MKNYLTWDSASKQGTFKQVVNGDIYEGSLYAKPVLPETFTDLDYNEATGTYLINSALMADSTKLNCSEFIALIKNPLKQLKEDKVQEIIKAHDNAVDAIIGIIPFREMASWAKQEEQARAWKLDNSYPTPTIDGLLSSRALTGETKDLLCDKIISNADGYEVEYSSVLGKCQSLLKKVPLATNENEVNLIVWSKA